MSKLFGKWFDFRDIYIVAFVLAVLGPILYVLDREYLNQVERQARAEPAVLQACTEIASQARGPFFSSVKEECLMKFDRSYAQARYRELR